MKKITGLLIFIASFQFSITAFAQDEQTTAQEKEYIAWATQLWDSFDRQTGIVKIHQANAVLDVPESFYYLNAQDAAKVLVDVWGNPPGQTTYGMLFPAESTPFDPNTWAVTIQYEEDGYVSDADADDIDYDDLLSQMKKDTRAQNKERKKQGYETIELVGWAAQPFYDKQQNKMHWAKELSFDGVETNTLNYNIRVLGRRGVLVLNFIAGIDQKELIEQNLDSVLTMTEFDEGSQYVDFNPDIDTVAAYGLGALVAGKLAAKAGLLAGLLLLLKKFGVFIVIGIGALFGRFFKKK